MSRTAKRATPKRSALPAAPAPVLVEAGVVPVLFLDANILLPQYLRSVFFDLADAGLAHVHWSQDVLVEVRRNLVSKRRAFNLEPTVADRLPQTMEQAFPDAEVQGTRPYRRGSMEQPMLRMKRRKMMQAWADYLDSLRSGASVIPMKRHVA